MRRKTIRTFALCAVAALCLALPFAASASAQTAHFNWAPSTTTMTDVATSVHHFSTSAMHFKCNEASGEVNVTGIAGPVESLTASNVSYSNNGNQKCIAETGMESAVEVKMNGCGYRFNAGQNTEIYGLSSGTVSLVCPGKKYIEIVAPSSACTVTVSPQNNLGTVSYTNLKKAGVPNEVEVSVSLNNVTYVYSGWLCGSGGGANGVYVGAVAVKGRNSAGEQTAVWVE